MEFFNSDCRFRFLAKKYECKVVFIFLYLDVITAKIKKNVQIWSSMLSCLKVLTFSLILAMITSEYKKMKTTLHSNFFARNPNLQSKLKNSYLRKRQKFVVRALQLRTKYLIAIRFYVPTFIFTDFFLGPRNNSQLGNHLWTSHLLLGLNSYLGCSFNHTCKKLSSHLDHLGSYGGRLVSVLASYFWR